METLDCSNIFRELFQILFYHSYEAKLHAYTILDEQKFVFNKQDLKAIKEEWEHIELNPELCICFDDARAMVEDVLQQYLAYLDE